MFDPTPASSDPSAPERLRRIAEEAARVGGALAREAFGGNLCVKLKSDQSEVTNVDVAAEKAIVEYIRAVRPNDEFIGEESMEGGARRTADPSKTPSGVAWIIDPIDGTRNFIRRMPLFAVSIAAMRGGVPVAGAIFEPVPDILYSANAGGGLFINGKPFRPAQDDRLSASDPDRKLYVGIPSARRESTQPLVLHTVENHVVRNFGSVAIHLALAALGHLDAVVVGNAKLWDIAAGIVLVEAAGGVAVSPAGDPLFPIDLNTYAGEEIPLLSGTAAAYERLRRELAGQA